MRRPANEHAARGRGMVRAASLLLLLGALGFAATGCRHGSKQAEWRESSGPANACCAVDGACAAESSCGACGSKSKCEACPDHPRATCALPTYETHTDDCVAIGASWWKANRALDRYEEETGCEPGGDFERGFRQAYIDIGLGLSGQVPVLPPSRYWRFDRRNDAGRAAAEEWFAGYEAGAEWARSAGWDQRTRVAARP